MASDPMPWMLAHRAIVGFGGLLPERGHYCVRAVGWARAVRLGR